MEQLETFSKAGTVGQVKHQGCAVLQASHGGIGHTPFSLEEPLKEDCDALVWQELTRWPSLALPSSLLPERLTSQTMELGGWKLRQPDSSQDGESWKGKYHIINMEFYNKLNLLNVGCVVISISERNIFSSKIQDVKRKAKQQAVLRGGEHSILQSCFWSEKGSTSKQLQEVPETDRIYSAMPFPCVYK